ncbi:unnamed protein product [Leptidea sinapis]|uniref:Myrosinase 1-like n=1 Tax=Leptidea sinapis TaxID=189913 RepID=A0A5E4Q414_9NEOP|nr:unnamed protein product [Leptidea sinapis]
MLNWRIYSRLPESEKTSKQAQILQDTINSTLLKIGKAKQELANRDQWARLNNVEVKGVPVNKSLANEINEAGLEYYDNLINELLKYNIQPMVTMYNLDLPQNLQELGGWTNPLVSQWFEDYAEVLFEKFSDRVKLWITINNPTTVCFETYSGVLAPGINSTGIGDYLCVKNVLVAHAKAYRLYESEVGISLLLNYPDTFDNKTENEQAAEKYREFTIGLYMNPIWSKYGDFPLSVRNTIAKKSKEQGYAKSRLPSFTADEIKLIKGSSDFLGLNHYTTYLIKATNKKYPAPSLEDDISVERTAREEWIQSQTSWLKSAPYGIYKLCLYINKMYDYPQIYVTEQGWSTTTSLNDRSRVENLREYLIALLFAIEDGAKVKGYTVWSLMDTVEWNAGTSERFGLYEVDFGSEEKTRKARLSALVYKRIIQKKIIEKDWEPKYWTISISNKTKSDKDEL